MADMRAYIKAIEYHLPEGRLTNEDLAADYPEWTVAKIEEKTGIKVRRIAAVDECSSDLGIAAAKKLFARAACRPDEIDYILFCTQSPDYFLPTTACLIQDRLEIPRTAGALDFNLGCSGYVYGLGLAKGLIETSQANNVLLITAETYSKFIHPGDKSVRTLFGDAATATLVRGMKNSGKDESPIGPFLYGTDGRGANNLIVPTGGLRRPRTGAPSALVTDESGNQRSDDHLYMNGSEIFSFTLDVVPPVVEALLARTNKTMDDVDLFIFHQANKFMLEHLQRKIKIPANKFYLSLEKYGNTVSSTIPIALKDAASEGRLASGDLVMLVGFGVGYSWGATLVRWV
jgi:3-oxoacyl-[acyl-carrier-protein] synthase-3